MEEKVKPLVSYIVYTYNQEKYIKEAVESAFAQSYSPLEIIITDDNSTDRTFEIIKELYKNYEGPHKVIINKNNENLGITGNLSKAMSIARGELFVFGAGDDISYSYRTEIIFNYWQKYKNEVFYYTSSMIGIDLDGKLCSKADRLFNGNLIQKRIKDFYGNTQWCGAGEAIDRRLYDIFGPIKYNFNEDRCFLSRAWFLGKTLAIKEVLLEYRIGGLSTFVPLDLRKKRKLDVRWILNSYLQIKEDLKKINIILKKDEYDFLNYQIEKWTHLKHFYNAETLWKQIKLFKIALKKGYCNINKIVFLLPDKLFLIIIMIYSFIVKIKNIILGHN